MGGFFLINLSFCCAFMLTESSIYRFAFVLSFMNKQNVTYHQESSETKNDNKNIFETLLLSTVK